MIRVTKEIADADGFRKVYNWTYQYYKTLNPKQRTIEWDHISSNLSLISYS